MTATHKRLPSGPASALYKAADAAADRRAEAVKAVLNTTAMGLGGGAAARGLLGLYRTIFPTKPLEDINPLLPRQIEIPVVRQSEQDKADRQRLGLAPDASIEEEALARQRAPSLDLSAPVKPPTLRPKPYKYAEARPLERLAQSLAKTAELDDWLKDPTGQAAKAIAPYAPNASMTIPGVGTLTPKNPAGSAPYIPMIIGGGAAGLYGGWKLVDYLLEKNREANVRAQLESAKKDYRRALNEQFQAELPPAKQAAAGTLDKVAAAFEKEGSKFLGVDLPDFRINTGELVSRMPGAQGTQDMANALGGAYAVALGLTGLGTGIGAYNWTRNRSEANALERALRRRRMERAGLPAPVMAVAKDVSPEEFSKA